MFLLSQRAENKLICPVLGIEIYIKICNLLAIDVTKGFLFRSLPDKFSSSAAQSKLDDYVKQLGSYFKERRLTLLGFRSGQQFPLISLTQV